MTRILLPSVVAVSLALSACSGSTTSTEPSTASTAQGALTTAPVAPQVKGHIRAVADALSSVPLRADQRTDIEQMATDADTRHTAARAAHAQLAEAIAAQIEAGAIDRAALLPKIDATADALATSRPADRAALLHLHAILTADQRAQFVDAMQSRRKAKHEGHGMHGRMEQWAKDLQLTDDQRTQITAIVKAQFSAHKDAMHAMHDAHEHGHDFMDSFKSDQLAPPRPADDARAHANRRADSFLGIATQVLPLLTPAQRALAATKIRARVQAGEEDVPSLGE